MKCFHALNGTTVHRLMHFVVSLASPKPSPTIARIQFPIGKRFVRVNNTSNFIVGSGSTDWNFNFGVVEIVQGGE